MSWRSGSKLFAEMWPLIQANIPDREHRVDFTARLLRQMVRDDMDPFDVEDLHSDVRAAMHRAGIEISGPESKPPQDSRFGCMRGTAEQLGDIVKPLSKKDWGSLV